MAKRELLSACLLAAALVALPAMAGDLKVGYVNTQRIIREAPAAIAASKRLAGDFGRREQDLQRLAGDIQAKQAALEKNAVTLSESERRAKEREIGELSRDLQRRQREFEEDVSLRRNEEGMALIDKANRAIEQIAEQEQFDLILQEALWAGPSIDITEKVIKALSEGK